MIYFIQQIGVPHLIKIGHTDSLDARMQALSASFDNGIELLATCSGGPDVEAAFHAMFSDDWTEGEWYRQSPNLQHVIDKFSGEVHGRRLWGRFRAVANVDVSAIDLDRQIARDKLSELMGRFGAMQFSLAQERAYQVLSSIDAIWTRRRVRAIWEKSARRIDHFEIRQLDQANAMSSEARAALQSQMGGLRRVDLPRNRGE